MNKKKKIIIVVMILVAFLSVCCLATFKYLKNKKNVTDTKLIEVLDTIKDYDYNLEDRDLDIYKETFYKLRDVLKEKDIDYEKYCTYVAELFLIDLYTIDNKLSKYDVGSLEFIFKNDRDKFQNKVMDTIYKLVKDNSNDNRKQELPVVTKVDVRNVTKTEYKKDEETVLEAYSMDANIEYQKDLGYDKSVKITVAIDDGVAGVVNLTNKEVEK